MKEDPNKIFIPGNCPSLKNSKGVIVRNGRGYLIPSELVQKYENANEWVYVANKNKFLSMIKNSRKPLKIKFFFVRDTQRKFDYINAAQIVLDMMVKAELLPDDNMTEVIPIFDGYSVDKENPGVYIYL